MTNLGQKTTWLFRLCHRRQAVGFLKYHGNGPQRDLYIDALEEIADALNMIMMHSLKLGMASVTEDVQSGDVNDISNSMSDAEHSLIAAAVSIKEARDVALGICPELCNEVECNRVGWTPNFYEGDAVEPISSGTTETPKDVRSSDSQPSDPRTACVGGS